MRVRYRKLTRSFDTKEYAGRVEGEAAAARQKSLEASDRSLLSQVTETDSERRGHANDAALAAGVVAAVSGLVSTPDQVQATEAEAELDEVRAMVRRGELTPNDLVNLGDGWTTIAACVPLIDDADPEPNAELERGATVIVVVVLGIIGALLVLGMLLG